MVNLRPTRPRRTRKVQVTAASVLVAILTSWCAIAASAEDQSLYLRPLEPTNPSFKRKTIIWQGLGYDGETAIAHGLESREGKVAVCGLHLSKGKYYRDELERTLRNARIVSGNDVLMTGLEYFREFKAPDRLLLRCKRTDLPWKARYGRRTTEMQLLVCKTPDTCSYK